MTYNRHRESKKVPIPEPKMDTSKVRTIPVPEPTMDRGKVGTTHVPVAAMIAGLTLLRSHWIVSPFDLWPNPHISWKIRAALAVGILTLRPRPFTLVCLYLVEGLLTTNAFLVGSLLWGPSSKSLSLDWFCTSELIFSYNFCNLKCIWKRVIPKK